jgi:23S rRNA pseudoU1915 N3-methylase RlmH
MRIELLLLGKTRRAEIRALLDDYAARVRRFAEFEMRELREDSPAAMRKLTIPAGATVVLLDAGGKKFDSQQFAAWLGATRDRGVRISRGAGAARHGTNLAFPDDFFPRTRSRDAR